MSVLMLIDQFTVVAGGVILSGSWVPQIVKTIRTKSSRDLSIPFLVAAAGGTLLLVPYSFLIEDAFFITVNLSAGLLAAVTLAVALIYRRSRN